MNNLIGLSLNEVEEELKNKNVSYKILNNNYNVHGDTELVTNVTMLKDETVILTVGSFIFNLKD